MITIHKSFFNSPFDTLPQLQHYYVILADGRKVESGNVLIRPINEYIAAGYDHYGFVYGTDTQGESWIIDMNKEEGVRCVSFSDFMKGFNISELRIKNKPSNAELQEILTRAKEWERKFYDFFSGNCHHFVNYSVYNDKRCLPIEIFKFIGKCYFEITKHRLAHTKDSHAQETLKRLMELEEQIDLEFDLNEIGENRLKNIDNTN